MTTPTETQQAAHRLKLAADLIEQAMTALDLDHEPCPTCGRRHWSNRQQAQLFETLQATPTKLREAAFRLGATDQPTA